MNGDCDCRRAPDPAQRGEALAACWKTLRPALIVQRDASERRARPICSARRHSGSTRNKGYVFEQRFETYLFAHHCVLRKYVLARTYEPKDIGGP
jgi:hypothetical protein